MKHRYIVISSFFIAIFLLTLLCYGSYLYSQKQSKEKSESDRTELTANSEDQKVTSTTKYFVEKYNIDTEELVTEETTMPAEYAGMTRKELEQYLGTCMETIATDDTEAGLVSMKLKSFSKEKIVIRKSYQTSEQESGFFLKLTDGEVVIYNRDGSYVYEKTGIKTENLPKKEREKLKKGYIVENEKDLYSILENFSS